MIIILTVLIVLFCFIGALMALLLNDSEKYRLTRWMDGESKMSEQRFYSHVEQGPDSLYPVKVDKDKNENANQINKKFRKEVKLK
ncbi:MAG: hypothetical protein AB1480_18095 [Nitrospirota bacterium]